jgi:hypothetical protein
MSLSNTFRKTGTIIGVTVTSAWLGGIIYSYYSIKNSKKMGEFDTFVFSLEGLRNSFFIGGAIGLVVSSVFTK